MSFRNYFKFFPIVILLLYFLFGDGSIQAFALQEEDIDESSSMQVKIYIDTFDAVTSIPEEYGYLKKAGPAMLRTALAKAALMEEHLKFAFVERRKINKILEEGGGIQQKLLEVFDEVREKLKAQGAEYVIFVDYFVLPGDRVRVDARMVKVAEVAAEISEFHVFSLTDPDPLQPLANKLVKVYLRKELPKGSVLRESFYLCILAFQYDGPKEFEKLRNIIPQSLTTEIVSSQLNKMTCSSVYDLENAKGKHLRQLAAEFPQIDYFVTGNITIFDQDEKTIAVVTIRNVDRNSKLFVSSETHHDPNEIISSREFLIKFVGRLKNKWPNITKASSKK